MLLEVNNLNLVYDKKTIFKDASFKILPGDKMGLVGNNGVGKTTLINVLCGKILPDSGKIDFNNKIKVGYLDQYMNVIKNVPIFDYLKEAFSSLYDEEKKMNDLLEQVKNIDDLDKQSKLIIQATSIQEKLEYLDFYQLDSKIMRIAKGLGITNYGMDTLLSKLSGGQKVKVILAKLLLETPNLLILDEPTNFLDTVHVEWLVKYLKEYKGNFLIVSHNQSFLNEVCNSILELEFGKLTRFKGNYQEYLKKKAFMLEQYSKDYSSQQREIKELKEYIAKNGVRASTAKQSQSRQKKLDKMEILQAPESCDIHLNLYFNYSPIASHKFLCVDNLEIGYTKSLLPPISFELKSGDHIAITGFNGIGKTTLFKTLIGELNKISGNYKFVEGAKIAYFEQEHHFDNLNYTPLQEIHNLYPSLDEKQVRDNLAKCGLRGSVVLQPLKTLSGGEQSKVKLCKVMMTKSNVLILDEPTNHLDKFAKEDLLKALKKYQGTIIFACHEKEFINELATKVYSIEDLLLI